MLRKILTGLFLYCAALPAAAFEIDAMSEAERETFRAEIRAYLLENPEVLMEAIAVLEERRAAEAAMQEQVLLEENQAQIFDDGFSWVGGNLEGDVTVVEFLDYRCGFCKRAYPAVKELLATDQGVRLIIKEFPILGAESELASRYAIATKLVEGDATYAKVHDALMEWSGALNEGALARIGRTAGVGNQSEVLAAMNSDEVSRVIAANRALGQTLQIQGTPSFIMEDTFVRGFIELDQMQSIIEEIRAKRG